MNRMFAGAAAVAMGLSSVVGLSSADAANDAVGPVTGTIIYGGDGIPPLDSDFLTDPDCRETTFELSLQAVIAVDYRELSFKGPVTITGNGRSGYNDDWRMCESVWQWTGAHGGMYLSMVGTDAFGVTIRCDGLPGTWLRYATAWTAFANGACAVDDQPFTVEGITIAAEWAPTPVGGGVTTDVTGALLTGALVM